MTPKATPIRVLIAEDSPVARELLVAILQSASGLQVVGTARDGAEAVRLARRLRPDIITMDAYMPELDGFAATRQIMAEIPRPIVIISAKLNNHEHDMTFSALQAGALSVLEKPTMYDPPEVYEALITQVKLMSEVKVVRRWSAEEQGSRGAIPTGGFIWEQGRTQIQPSLARPSGLKWNERPKIQLVAMASSTGGPGVLAKILSELPANFPAPILIVQHITPGFGMGLASWLNKQTPLEVRLAQHAEQPRPGQVLIAPDNYHMLVNHLRLITLSQAPPEHHLRPSADVLFQSVAQVYGATALGIILTGMGNDGAQGLYTMRATGAPTIAQDKDSCVVFGMPAVAINLGAAEQILPAHQIAAAMTHWVQVKEER